MTISAAFSSAISGLAAAGRASAIVSENIANSMTPGFARRSLSLASDSVTGPGVRVLGVARQVDPGLIANRRGADAEFGAARALADFYTRLETLTGTVANPDSIATRLADFEASLISAASRPDSVQRLNMVATRANDVVGAIAKVAGGLTDLRNAADRSIDDQVTRLNRALRDVEALNTRITATASGGGNTAGLLDQRQLLLDEINGIVPVNVVDRDFGQVALYSNGGAILLDGRAATLDFTRVNGVMPEMTVGNGALSGLRINGLDVRTDSMTGALRGGTLGVQFQIRDELAVSAQADLDALTRDLIERFEDSAVDSTRPAGAPGLFADSGSAFDPAAEVGVSGRVSLNSEVDPAQGGDSWKLRAGLGAPDPGLPGEARLLQAFGDALAAPRSLVSGDFGTGRLSVSAVATGFMSNVSQNRDIADERLSFASASQTELARAELEQGVDTDAELQSLMLIEQAYAANARVLKAADEMMQTLLRF